MKEGRIDLDWLDGEIANDIYDFRFRGALDYVRKNCIPIEEPEKEELPKYCKVNNKEYCFLSGACKECSIEPPVFLSKTCVNNWESSQYCDKEGVCEMCVNGKLK